MRSFHIALIFLALASIITNAAAQNAVRVRGTITAFDGNVLSVKSREGNALNIELADVKPGTPLGTSAVKGADGKLIARELHVFPADRAIPNEGHRDWDLEPGSTMTNARVSAVVQATNGRELTLSYKGGTQQVVVPENVPVVMAMEADRSLLIPGEYVVVAATVGADGKVTATRVQVSKDGVKPPQ